MKHRQSDAFSLEKYRLPVYLGVSINLKAIVNSL